MNRQVLSGGTIVCSAMIFYGWAQSSASNPNSPECSDRSAKPASSRPSKQSTDAKKHCSQLPTIEMGINIPEQLLNLQWGNRKSNQLGNNIETVYDNLIKQAQTLASRNQPMQAIAKIAGIPRNSRHYEMAQQLQEDWSRELLRQATGECQQARVAKALSMLNAIPATSRSRNRATELRRHWSQQAGFLNRAIAARKTGNWQGVIDAIQLLEGAPMYHSLLVQGLLQQAMTNLYEPDAVMLQTATEDLPTVQLPTAPSEASPNSAM
ncbi:MAG: hypothetical protein HC866_09655 [Leptolyngbyaceae cyanobacterium RU_5_1]|nr:hypothetical protein [Leptolyngbyaceae cyanobacterium RU_5_1]